MTSTTTPTGSGYDLINIWCIALCFFQAPCHGTEPSINWSFFEVLKIISSSLIYTPSLTRTSFLLNEMAMLFFLARRYKRMQNLLDYKTKTIMNISIRLFLTPMLMLSYKKFEKNISYTYFCGCIHTRAHMYKIDALPIFNENKCVSCCKCSNIK